MPAPVLTNAEYEAKRKSGEMIEPKSTAKMSAGLKILNALNWATNPDARKHEAAKPDPNERLIVVMSETSKGEVGTVYKGIAQPDGSIFVNSLNDAQMHYSRTDKRGVSIIPQGKTVSDEAVGKLKEWRKNIEHPQLPVEQGPGYSTGGPYDPAPQKLPMGTPMGKTTNPIAK